MPNKKRTTARKPMRKSFVPTGQKGTAALGNLAVAGAMKVDVAGNVFIDARLNGQVVQIRLAGPTVPEDA